MITEDQKIHCIHGSTKNQENKAVNNNIITSLSIILTDSLHLESDKMNDWMLEAKDPKNGPIELKQL